jgi:hypothetical protein
MKKYDVMLEFSVPKFVRDYNYEDNNKLELNLEE